MIAGDLVRLINDTSNTNAASEITLMEFHNQLYIAERDSALTQLDSAWVDSCFNQVMDWVGRGKVEILGSPPKLIEKAMSYVRYATREKGRNLRSWDATHLYMASAWARSLGEIVRLATTNGDFPRILDAFPEFTRYVRVYDLETQTVYP